MNIQQLRVQIEALQSATMDENKNFRSAYDEGKFDALSVVDALLDSLQEEPVSEELEKAAVEAFKQIVDSDKNNFLEIFKAGAKWQKQQMMSKAIDTTIKQGCIDLGIFIKGLDKNKFSFGDKVKVIVVKGG